MSMLNLKDVRPGTLQDARVGSILLPVGSYSAHFLVTAGAQDELFGVFLTGEYRFSTVMASEDGENWPGFFVDDIRLEVAIDSASDATSLRPPIGSIVTRPSGTFLVAVTTAPASIQRRVELALGIVGGPTAERVGVAFSRWNVVSGEGTAKVVLFEMDAGSQA